MATFSEVRKKMGITIYRIKKETGLNRKTLRNIERNLANPRIDTVQKISKLGIFLTIKDGKITWWKE